MKYPRLGLVLAVLSVAPASSFAQQRPSAAASGAVRAPSAAPAVAASASARPSASATPSASASAGASATAGGLSAAQIVTRMQEFYNRTQDFDAHFQQVNRNRLNGTQRTTEGRVRFRRPGRMRWDYTTPAGDLIVSDGRQLWTYEAEGRQAINVSMQNSQIPSALSFLMGTGDLARDFTFRVIPEPRYTTGYVLEGRPVTPTASYDRILFYVDRTSFQVTKTVVLDAQGNTNSFVFTGVQVNLSPAESLFQWSPPAGVSVVRP